MLMLHRGAEAIALPALKTVAIPDATDTHIPLAHFDLVEMVKYALGYFGHEVVSEDHAVTPDGARYFGLLTLKSEYGLYTDTLGLRNSNDKRFPIGIAYGGKVFCCDNLSFHGDFVVTRKHTANSRRDLPGLVAELIRPLSDKRALQAQTFEMYRQTPLLPNLADQAIMSMYRQGVINVTRIAEVVELFDNPTHEEWGDHTAWTLFNAATSSLEGKVAENPSGTAALHKIIDGTCRVVH